MRWTYVAEYPYPPDQVYRLISDLGQIPRWEDGVRELHPITPLPLRTGSIFHERRVTMGKPEELVLQLIEHEPDRAFCVQSLSGTPFVGHRHLEPIAGGTRVTEISTATLPGLLELLSPLLQGTIRAANDRSYGRIRQLLGRG